MFSLQETWEHLAKAPSGAVYANVYLYCTVVILCDWRDTATGAGLGGVQNTNVQNTNVQNTNESKYQQTLSKYQQTLSKYQRTLSKYQQALSKYQ